MFIEAAQIACLDEIGAVSSLEPEKNLIEVVSTGSKQFYSAGAAFSTLACSTTVLITWGALGQLYEPLSGKFCALILSFLIVLAYALVIPEPAGYPNAGKLRLTLAEIIFGIMNTFIVYSTAVALKAL